MSEDIKLTEQETRVVDFLRSKTNGSAHWEELAQFAKSPQTVKLKTIRKTVSEIKRKYLAAGQSVPFNVNLSTMQVEEEEAPQEVSPPLLTTTIGDLIRQKLEPALTPHQPQNLVQIKRTPAGNTMIVNSNNAPSLLPAQLDFALDLASKRVKTRYGSHLLNENEWEVFKYFHAHAGKLVPISELRDKVMYENYGSKLPARWFDSIMRVINNMRRQIPGLEHRLLTVKGAETSYLFQ